MTLYCCGCKHCFAIDAFDDVISDVSATLPWYGSVAQRTTWSANLNDSKNLFFSTTQEEKQMLKKQLSRAVAHACLPRFS